MTKTKQMHLRNADQNSDIDHERWIIILEIKPEDDGTGGGFVLVDHQPPAKNPTFCFGLNQCVVQELLELV